MIFRTSQEEKPASARLKLVLVSACRRRPTFYIMQRISFSASWRIWPWRTSQQPSRACYDASSRFRARPWKKKTSSSPHPIRYPQPTTPPGNIFQRVNRLGNRLRFLNRIEDLRLEFCIFEENPRNYITGRRRWPHLTPSLIANPEFQELENDNLFHLSPFCIHTFFHLYFTW